MKFSEEAKSKAEGRFPSSLVAIDWFGEEDMMRVSSDDIVLVDKMSSGAFATVYRGLYKGKYYAVKKESFHKEGESQANLLVELSLLQTYPHDRLVRFVTAAYDSFSNGMLIVMELCSKGDLRHFMKEYVVDWPLKMQIASDVARGLNFMHEIGIIHRDIKTSNILIDENFNGKICDFSFAIFDQSTDKLQLTYGTDEFMSPEIALALDFSFKSDIFSFGIVLSEMITEREPSKDFMARRPQNMFAVNELEVRESVLPGCPVVMEALALQCCDIDVSRRPLSSDLIEELAACLLSEFNVPPSAVPSPVLRRLADTPPSPPRASSIAPSPRNSISKEGGDSGVRIAMLEQQMRELQSENRQLRSDISLILKELTPSRNGIAGPSPNSVGFLTPQQASSMNGSVLTAGSARSSATTPVETLRNELDSLQSQLNLLKSSISSSKKALQHVSSTPPCSPARRHTPQSSELQQPQSSPERQGHRPPNPTPNPIPDSTKSSHHLAQALNSFLEIADKCSATSDRTHRLVAQIDVKRTSSGRGDGSPVDSNGTAPAASSGSPAKSPSHPDKPIFTPRRLPDSPGTHAVRSRARSSSGEGRRHVPVDYHVPPKHPAPHALARWQNKAYESMRAGASMTEGVSLDRPSR